MNQETVLKRIEELARLREDFGSAPTIRYGGSQAKGTLIKDSYDLDIVCYFPRDDDDAGDTLEEIYTNTKDELEKHYLVECVFRNHLDTDSDLTWTPFRTDSDSVPGALGQGAGAPGHRSG